MIYCCACLKDVDARLTSGREIYPYRHDLHVLPFWRCDTCKNFVGCHHKTNEPTRPLGCIPTPEIKEARKRIHAVIDPILHRKLIPRGKLYKQISKALGYEYHTAEIRSVEDAERICKIAEKILRAAKNRAMSRMF